MAISWRDTAAEFERILRAHGVEPDTVTTVDAAWAAFGEFVQVGVGGIDGAENDGDGFSVEWGRWTWNRNRPALAFRRLLAVLDTPDRTEPDDQPEYWVVELELSFAESAAWADLGEMISQGTGFEHYPIGARRRAALAEVRQDLATYPQLAALWRAAPIDSGVRLERV